MSRGKHTERVATANIDVLNEAVCAWRINAGSLIEFAIGASHISYQANKAPGRAQLEAGCAITAVYTSAGWNNSVTASSNRINSCVQKNKQCPQPQTAA